MSITDELREYASLCPGGMGGDALRHIADRIDEQHRKALERVAAMVDEPDETERRIKALEHLTDGMLLDESELRELVLDMWNWLAPTAVGGGAPLKWLHNRMRELGVDA